MDGKERATVMLIHGDGEDRLRQAISQGLVSKEVQKYIEDTLEAAEDARVYAESMQAQVEKQKKLITALEDECDELRKQADNDAAYYSKAIAAYKREEKRRKDKADRVEAFSLAAIGAIAFIGANVIGHFIFGLMFK